MPSAIAEILSSFFFFLLHFENQQELPPALSEEEQEKLYPLVAMKDRAAREKLIVGNMRLVHFLINGFDIKNTFFEKDDLAQIGMSGLIKAADTFDPSKKTKFSTYASRCILREVGMAFRRIKNEPPVPVKGKNESEDGYMAEPYVDGDEPINETYFSQVRAALEKCLGGFRQIEQEIVRLRFGFHKKYPGTHTQQETADILKMTRGNVAAKEGKIKKKLKEGMKGLYPFDIS